MKSLLHDSTVAPTSRFPPGCRRRSPRPFGRRNLDHLGPGRRKFPSHGHGVVLLRGVVRGHLHEPRAGFANSPYFDTTPGFGTQWSSSANLTQYYIPLTSLTLTPGFINMNSYSGNTSTGSIVGFYDNFSGDLVLVLDSSYQAGDSIAATLTSYAYEQTLNQSFLFGDVVKLNGAPLITFVQGVPEPSTYGLALGGVALALGALRRRRRS